MMSVIEIFRQLAWAGPIGAGIPFAGPTHGSLATPVASPNPSHSSVTIAIAKIGQRTRLVADKSLRLSEETPRQSRRPPLETNDPIDRETHFQSDSKGDSGKITTFDVPGAGTGTGQGTVPYGLNPVGNTIGRYVDASNVDHGFLRDPWGRITTFDAPGAGTGAGQGTIALTFDKVLTRA